MSKTAEAFRTISEVADDLDVPKHVLRFWEVKFPQIRPMKRGGGRRYYRPEDLELLRGIRHLLHAEGYTIKGVQKILREHGVEHVKVHGRTVVAAGDAKRKVRAPQNAEGESAAPTRAAPRRGQKDAIVPAGGGRAPDMRSSIMAAIAQLEDCRRILRGDPPRAELASPAKSARARASRA